MATNGNMTFGDNIDVSKGVTGLIEGKATQKKFMNDYWKDNGYLSESIKELQQMKASYLEMSNISKSMNQADREAIRKKISELNVQLAIVTKIKETQSVSYKKAIDSVNSTNKLLEKGQKRYYELLSKAKDKDANLTKSQLKALDQAITKYENMLDLTEEQREEFERIKKILDQAPTNFGQAFAKTTKAVGKDLKDIADTLNINKIANSAISNFARDKIAIMNDINKQLGFTQAGQFDAFKSGLNKTLSGMNSSMNGLFNSGDVSSYLQNLSTLGITNAQMAQSQMKNSIIANKYLGVSMETQEAIFKFMKLTNNNTVLEDHNKTIVGILKANLGISKEQLDALSQIAYGSNDSKMALGMSAAAVGAQNEALTIAGAALENIVGADKAKSITESINKFMTSPGDSGWASIFGTGYSSLYNKGFKSQTKEEQLAFINEFIGGLQESGLLNATGESSNSLATASGKQYTNAASGLGDDVLTRSGWLEYEYVKRK